MNQQNQQISDSIFPCGQSLERLVNQDAAKYSNNVEENGVSDKSNFPQNSSIDVTSYRLSEERVSDENVCKSCGKGFQSSKALFGHMKCHSEKLIANTSTETGRQSDKNEEHETSSEYSRRRSTRLKRDKTSDTSENEQEDVAMSLMMLSKDDCGSKELCSYSEDIVIVRTKTDRLGSKRVIKRNKFQCGTCNKVFQSHQALGGHRASHKKIKGCYASKFEQVSTNSTEQEQAYSVTTDNQELTDITTNGSKKGKSAKYHECPFCFKVFASGQALGGHKRSHLLNSSGINSNKSIVIQERDTNARHRGLFDLNLPAPTEEDTLSQVTDFNKWGGLGGCGRPESPVEFSL